MTTTTAIWTPAQTRAPWCVICDGWGKDREAVAKFGYANGYQMDVCEDHHALLTKGA